MARPWKHVIYRKNKAIGWLTRVDMPQVGKGQRGYLYHCHLTGDMTHFRSCSDQGAAERAVVEEVAKRVGAK